MKNKKIPQCRTALVSGKKLEATGKLDTANTNIYIHSRLLSCIGTSISMKTDGVKPVVWIQTVPVGKMMRSCNLNIIF